MIRICNLDEDGVITQILEHVAIGEVVCSVKGGLPITRVVTRTLYEIATPHLRHHDVVGTKLGELRLEESLVNILVRQLIGGSEVGDHEGACFLLEELEKTSRVPRVRFLAQTACIEASLHASRAKVEG